MPKGPQGQKRAADVIGAAIKVAQIATGEIEEKPNEGKGFARQGGLKGSGVRTENLTAKRRSESARKAAKSRWGKPRKF